jgi:hypothetical protein
MQFKRGALPSGAVQTQARNTPKNKELAYLRGFRKGAKDHGFAGAIGHCPYSVLDDPGVTVAGAFELGYADGRRG